MEYKKEDFDKIRNDIIELQRKLGQMVNDCKHEVPNYKQDSSARCQICGKYFGWSCHDSPDHVCHYFSIEKDGQIGVELIDGSFYPLPNHNADYESDDWCIFCQEPDERK